MRQSIGQNQVMVAVRAASFLVGLGAAVYLVWFGTQSLISGEEQVWFAIAVISMAPVLSGAGLVGPSVLTTRSGDERTLLIAQLFPSVCLAAAMFVWCLALSAALGGGWWYLAGICVGALSAIFGVSSMKHLREITECRLAGEPPVYRSDSDYSRSEIVSVVIRSVLSLSVTIILLSGLAYVILGGTAAVVTCSALLLLLASFYAVTLARVRAHRRDHHSV